MPDKTETIALIEVMQAFVDGKPIQLRTYNDPNNRGDWYTLKPNDNPNWNWESNTYRIKPLEKPSIDWSQIPDAYRWLAVDGSGCAYVYVNEPILSSTHVVTWFEPTRQHHRIDHIHKSYKCGTVDWRDSLVERT